VKPDFGHGGELAPGFIDGAVGAGALACFGGIASRLIPIIPLVGRFKFSEHFATP